MTDLTRLVVGPRQPCTTDFIATVTTLALALTMLLNVAFRTLLHDRGKLIAGLIGVIFSVVLVNIQGGLFFGLIGKASLLIDRGHADIWVGHQGMHNVDFPADIPERWIYRVQTIPGVAEARPFSNLPSWSMDHRRIEPCAGEEQALEGVYHVSDT